ncbi:Icc protein [Thermosporothrix hazakensis]|jgi:Icc protein|uniref:Icc protein n=2 Tax=Thermosporothrix TaxID=768650 RepID=A0A326U5K1_THEHA|nr:metallophosphoesterase [Thermosporothrix hazakensis]PZW29210.1 Icc protein [Thermosporothrix hazakensis]BBH86140.1 3',5'-cyclic adenosine monophosphate phosphodiesterase CpdA [Thermosporothrix sp. COM3]GCE45438.1 3',5'-cyclic adenosine monophosphate phosphodiesterase CpdA [Thermosporothrix hazakensis]
MSFSFIQITDHHLGETEASLLDGYATAHAFRKVMRHIAEHTAVHVDFLVSTGDLVDDPSEVSYRNLCQMLELQPAQQAPGPALVSIEGLQRFPMYFLPGNHDDRENFFRHLFPGTPPVPHMNARFEHKGVQFLCLDWGPRGKAVPHQDTLEFLAQSLQHSMPTILLMHHHILPVGSRWIDSYLPDDFRAFWKLLDGHQILGIFYGHTHVTSEKLVANIPVYGLRSTAMQFTLTDPPVPCAQPLQYRLVTVQDGFLTTRLFEIPL